MNIVKAKDNFDCEKFIILQLDLFGSLAEVFYEIINDFDSNKNYEKLIRDCFLKFKNKSDLKLNFEFSYGEFRIFEKYHYSPEDWIVIYKLFNKIINENDELTAFIKLFYYGLIYVGPFCDDVESLDMSDSLLNLMSEEVKKLFWTFDEFYHSRNPDLIINLVDISKDVPIPIYIVKHLAFWVNDHISMHPDEMKKYEDICLDLYLVAFKKIFNKYLIDDYDVLEYDGMRLDLDTSNFSEEQIDKVYSKLSYYNQIY